MYYKSKKFSLTTLFFTAIVCSFAVIFFLNNQDGNLVVVFGLGVLIFILSLAVYMFDSNTKFQEPGINLIDHSGINLLQDLSFISLTGLKRLLFVIGVQILIAVGFFLYLIK